MTSGSARRHLGGVALVLAALAPLGCRGADAARRAPADGPPPAARLTGPPGFHVTVFSAAVPGARSLTLGAKGTVFVGTQAGAVYAVVDRDHDGVDDRVETTAPHPH
ncbi:MAG TPA: hypothetical protein VGQ33_02815, partial [Vicinamibacteria bacterium]|nr:hypothetical protein [Vicinamibacteria bacterium]